MLNASASYGVNCSSFQGLYSTYIILPSPKYNPIHYLGVLNLTQKYQILLLLGSIFFVYRIVEMSARWPLCRNVSDVVSPCDKAYVGRNVPAVKGLHTEKSSHGKNTAVEIPCSKTPKAK